VAVEAINPPQMLNGLLLSPMKTTGEIVDDPADVLRKKLFIPKYLVNDLLSKVDPLDQFGLLKALSDPVQGSLRTHANRLSSARTNQLQSRCAYLSEDRVHFSEATRVTHCH
jgi:hypothetical protein